MKRKKLQSNLAEVKKAINVKAYKTLQILKSDMNVIMKYLCINLK